MPLRVVLHILLSFVRFSIILSVAVGLFCGCAASKQPKQLDMQSRDDRDREKKPLDEQQVQSLVMSLSDDLTFAVADACSQISARTTRADSQLYCNSLRLGVATSAISAAVARNPRVGYGDLVTTAMLERISLEEPATARVLDPTDREQLHLVFEREENVLWSQLTQLITQAQADELRTMIMEWRKAHPDRESLTQVRLQELAAWRQTPTASPSTWSDASVLRLLRLDPMQGLDPATRQIKESRLLAERLGFWAQRLPMIVGWQMELTSSRLLQQASVNQVVENSTQFTTATTQFSKATTQIAQTYDKMLAELPKERQAAIEQTDKALAAQLKSLVDQTSVALAAERKAAIEQTDRALAAQVKSTIDQTSAALTAERKAAIDQAGEQLSTHLLKVADRLGDRFQGATQQSLDHADQILDSQRAGAVADVEATTQRLIDRFTLRLFLAAIASGVVIGLIMVTFRALGRRSRARPAEPVTVETPTLRNRATPDRFDTSHNI